VEGKKARGGLGWGGKGVHHSWEVMGGKTLKRKRVEVRGRRRTIILEQKKPTRGRDGIQGEGLGVPPEARRRIRVMGRFKEPCNSFLSGGK